MLVLVHEGNVTRLTVKDEKGTSSLTYSWHQLETLMPEPITAYHAGGGVPSFGTTSFTKSSVSFWEPRVSSIFSNTLPPEAR